MRKVFSSKLIWFKKLFRKHFKVSFSSSSIYINFPMTFLTKYYQIFWFIVRLISIRTNTIYMMYLKSKSSFTNSTQIIKPFKDFFSCCSKIIFLLIQVNSSIKSSFPIGIISMSFSVVPSGFSPLCKKTFLRITNFRSNIFTFKRLFAKFTITNFHCKYHITQKGRYQLA